MKKTFVQAACAALALAAFAGCAHYDYESVPKVEVSEMTVTATSDAIGEAARLHVAALPDYVCLSSPAASGEDGSLVFNFDKWPDRYTPAYALYNYIDGASYEGVALTDDSIGARLPVVQKDCPNIYAGAMESAGDAVWSVNMLPVCCQLVFSFSNHEDIAAFTLYSNQGQPLCGDIAIPFASIDDGNPSCVVSSGVDSVSLRSVAKAFAKGEFTFTVLPSGDFTPVLCFTDTLGRRAVVKYEDVFRLEPGKTLELKDCDKKVIFGIDPSDVGFGNEDMTPGGEFDGEWEK